MDIDGVLADFEHSIGVHNPNVFRPDYYTEDERDEIITQICTTNNRIFKDLLPIPGAIDATHELMELYDVHFLSTPMWDVPHSFMDKRIWLEKHFGDKAKKRLILTHRKDLTIGDFLVDDRIVNGVENFTGVHIHFGSDLFPSWNIVLPYLKSLI